VRSLAACAVPRALRLVDSWAVYVVVPAVSSPAAMNAQDLLIHESHKATAVDIEKLERELEGLARVRQAQMLRVQPVRLMQLTLRLKMKQKLMSIACCTGVHGGGRIRCWRAHDLWL
jgi:hypothetical protein